MNDWVGQRAWAVKSARHSPDSRVPCRVVALIGTSSTIGCRLVITAPPSKHTAWHEGPRTLCATPKAAPIMELMVAVYLAARTGLRWLMNHLTDGAAPTSVMTSALGFLGFRLSASKGFHNVERFRIPRRVRRGHAGRPARGLKSRVQLESTPHHIPASKRRTVLKVSLQEQCRNGDGAACGRLGMHYGAGDGVPRDPMHSHLLLSQACGMRDVLICQNLAVIYENRDGVAADSQRANLLYERACLLGGAEACSHLADNLTDGDGATKDPLRAAELYKKACQGGYSEAYQWAPEPEPGAPREE